MKKIFDWMREQFGKIIGEVHSPADVVWNNAVKMCIAKVDEAEAKWEAEACEWKYNDFEEQWETSCGVLLNPNSNDREATFYCCHCGKPIKIVEVE